MISDLTERFRYRFKLWRRERQEDLWGVPRDGSQTLGEYLAEQSDSSLDDPAYRSVLTESTTNFVGRSLLIYAGVLFFAALLRLILVRWFPSAQHAFAIGFAVFALLWTVVAISGTLQFLSARRRRRLDNTKSSNQAMERTDAR